MYLKPKEVSLKEGTVTACEIEPVSCWMDF